MGGTAFHRELAEALPEVAAPVLFETLRDMAHLSLLSFSGVPGPNRRWWMLPACPVRTALRRSAHAAPFAERPHLDAAIKDHARGCAACWDAQRSHGAAWARGEVPA